MQLPKPLLRLNPKVHKHDFGHVLVIAGSPEMLGAAALTSLSAMRAGAGCVTAAVGKNLNIALRKHLSPVVMTWPLPQTRLGYLGHAAFKIFQGNYQKFTSIAIGPGLSVNAQTQKAVIAFIKKCSVPLVIDADALTALSADLKSLHYLKTPKILTPHVGEMARLCNIPRSSVEKNRTKIAKDFAHKYGCILLLKGPKTIVADPHGKIYVNQTGNAGMATAGSGDVLTGIIAAFLAQGLTAFDAAKYGSYVHGLAGDRAAKKISATSMIATDIIDNIRCHPRMY